MYVWKSSGKVSGLLAVTANFPFDWRQYWFCKCKCFVFFGSILWFTLLCYNKWDRCGLASSVYLGCSYKCKEMRLHVEQQRQSDWLICARVHFPWFLFWRLLWHLFRLFLSTLIFSLKKKHNAGKGVFAGHKNNCNYLFSPPALNAVKYVADASHPLHSICAASIWPSIWSQPDHNNKLFIPSTRQAPNRERLHQKKPVT